MEGQPAWWQAAVIYQLYPRSFMDTNADGVGDLRGIISKLDYLNDGSESSLGIDAIWLNPVYPSPHYDFGYDIMDHCAIDPQYGTLADFDCLVREAHRRGIRIIMDFVPSVTSHLHPWFVESRASVSNPKRDWYLWKTTTGRPRYPNNWLGFFGGRAWEWDNKTKAWYYHNSLPQQPDLNWRNPAVEQAMLATLRFWFERGVDGFRIDVLNYAYKDQEFRSNPYCLGRRPYEMQRHIHDKDIPESFALARKIRRVADEYPEKMLVAEIFHPDIDFARHYLGDHHDGVHMVFNFGFMSARFDAACFRQKVLHSERAVAHRGWPAYFLSNHDHVRHFSRYASGAWSTARARVAAALLLTLRGTPFLYMGEEIGMEQGLLRRHEIMDPPGRRYWPFFKGRDGARTPMQWDASPQAGFSTVSPWLRVHPNYPQVNVAQQARDSRSLLAFYRRLIWWRKQHPALTRGSLTMCTNHRQVLAYLREEASERLLICLNFSRHVQAISPLPLNGPRGVVVFSSEDSAGQAIGCDRITLAPYAVLIVSL